MDYDFHKYVCEVTGLTCCGCSLFCGNRLDKTDEADDTINMIANDLFN